MDEKKFSWLDLIRIGLIALLIEMLFRGGSGVSHGSSVEMFSRTSSLIMKSMPYMMLVVMVMFMIAMIFYIYDSWKKEKLTVKQLVIAIVLLIVLEVIMYLTYQHMLDIEASLYDILPRMSAVILDRGFIHTLGIL